MQLQEQFDEIFRPPGDTPGASRKRNFGAKPKLWDMWIRLDNLQNRPADELADIKVSLHCTLCAPLRNLNPCRRDTATLCYVSPTRNKTQGLGIYTAEVSISRAPA